MSMPDLHQGVVVEVSHKQVVYETARPDQPLKAYRYVFLCRPACKSAVGSHVKKPVDQPLWRGDQPRVRPAMYDAYAVSVADGNGLLQVFVKLLLCKQERFLFKVTLVEKDTLCDNKLPCTQLHCQLCDQWQLCYVVLACGKGDLYGGAVGVVFVFEGVYEVYIGHQSVKTPTLSYCLVGVFCGPVYGYGNGYVSAEHGQYPLLGKQQPICGKADVNVLREVVYAMIQDRVPVGCQEGFPRRKQT
ncbi:hypothetical protein MBAV_000445 [Candidatus Magnetobacterium bavaricum]|uniref:Uncharacterized protein n=1 Tax=Candidatus Magnetobacterium bavaricum TaxID=29290 RepID=A0A0F3GZN0_9BACT|nr:hypothetical protein MBAV_000445 [Candidatus Magnetobacterium bavaricum]